MTMQNIERMLADQPVPSPPEGLAEQIKAEVPDNIEVHPGLTETAIGVPWHRRRNLRLAVAAIFVVALTAAVSWQMRQTTVFGPDRTAVRESTVVAGQSPVEVVDQDERGTKQELKNEITEREEGLVGADSAAPAERRISEIQVSVESPRISEGELRESIEPQAQPNEEMIEQAMKRSFEGEATVTGSLIPRADLTTAEPSVGDAAPARDSAVTRPSVPGTSRSIGGQVASDGKEIEYEITDEMIEQAVERSFEAEVTVTGSSGQSSGRLSATNWRRQWNPKAGGSPSSAPKVKKAELEAAAPSTGGTEEPNDQPYGDVFFREYGVNPFIDAEDDRFSTFGLEVDTGSYNVVRRYLRDGHLPPREAVRVEEIVNAFDYGDPFPTEADFGLTAAGASSPFADGPRYKILRFGVTSREVDTAERPAAVLTFAIDVSGSMDSGDRLGLVKRALFGLIGSLREDDRVGLVIYGSQGEVLLEPSTDHEAIRSAVERLSAGGSTNAEEGLVIAYELADRFRDDELINRVILCSDGVANVGRTGPESILERIRGWADNGIELTTVGFGMGNYNDVLMEQLADAGDGRYAYIDTFDEAHRLFVEELSGTLLTIGSEAKAQVEFNPEVVSRYRLLGYENRDIADEDFRNDAVDAGEIGAGHTATAIYEIKLHRDLRRQSREPVAMLRVRYLPFESDRVKEINHELRLRDIDGRWEKASPGLKLATLVAEYAEILKGSFWARTGDMDDVLRRAHELAPAFDGDERFAEWLDLVEIAAELINEADENGVQFTD